MPNDTMIFDDDLYRQIIIDHYQNPHHKGALDCPTHHLEGFNASCGDQLELDLRIKDGKVVDVGFEGSGCAISMTSTSMLTDLIIGKSVDEAMAITKAFKARLLGKDDEIDENIDIGELEALDGVKAYPVRIKCALLSWNTLLEGLEHPEGIKM